jgi:endo-1,4-beta-xylanase
VRRRICAVLVAAVLAAAAPAANIIGGGDPPAAASAGPGTTDATGPGVVTPTGAADGTGDAADASAAADGADGARGAAGSRRGGSTVRAPGGGGDGGSAQPGGGGGGRGPVLTGPLRALAARRGIAVGASVLTSSNLTDAKYASVLGSEYSMLTPENDMKWSAIHPEPGVYDFVAPDLDVSFAQSHAMAVRGHNLAWWANNPAWLTSVPYSRDQLIGVLHDHIQTVVGHYRGKVAQWDVVNEGLKGFWWDHIGPEYIDMAFRWAHEADPTARLFYNDSGGEGLGAHSDAVYNLVRGLKERGVPIHGVGLESHFDLNPPQLRDIAANMARLNALGLESAITEVDVRVRVPPSASDLERQRTIYNALLTTCLAAVNCKTFASWGFTDKTSWVPSAYPGYGAALPFDANYAPKPAYYGLRAALGG